MKNFKRLTVIALMFMGANNLVAEALSFPVNIKQQSYSTAISRKGYLTNIKVGEDEYLSDARNIPGRFYFISGKVMPFKNIVKVDDNNYEAYNEAAKISYSFGADKITISLTEVKKKGALYMIIDKGATKVNYRQKPSDSYRTAATPKAVKCTQTQWFKGGSILDITGSYRIWGPWKDQQVWELRLAAGKDYTVTITPGKNTIAKETTVQKNVPEEKVENSTTPRTAQKYTYAETTTPAQVPLCMIGDSITWWNHGDYWRKYLLEDIPNLAFIGTHTAWLGYSHAGEGGNNSFQILNRIDEIPAAPYYHLLIGTNDNNVKSEEMVFSRAKRTSGNIIKILDILLKKPGAKKVFLGTTLPCDSDSPRNRPANPLRMKTNLITNALVHFALQDSPNRERIILVDYATPILNQSDWRKTIRLHPTQDGYRTLASTLAKALRKEFGLNGTISEPVPQKDSGVRVVNIWKGDASGTTPEPIISGWYTLSFKVDSATDAGKILLKGNLPDAKSPVAIEMNLKQDDTGKRVHTSAYLHERNNGRLFTLEVSGGEISNILLEKMRPSRTPSIYGKGDYIDTKTKPSLGELVELP